MSLQWKIDEASLYEGKLHLRGWCTAVAREIVGVAVVFLRSGLEIRLKSYGLPSPDIASAVASTATFCRFDEWMDAPAEDLGRDFLLRVYFQTGESIATTSAIANALAGDPFHGLWDRYIQSLDRFSSGSVLEIGSRARSAVTRKEAIPPRFHYVGLDILPGPNVDVVGDAHRLSQLFQEEHFVGVFSFSVFEHLAMPWKVAIEINRVLKKGGLACTLTHQTWPQHEAPWDFWRFSKYAWKPLFNEATGFAIVEAVEGEPARIHGNVAHPATRELHLAPAYLGSGCIVEKTSPCGFDWPVDLERAVEGHYPKGELKAPVS